MAAAGKTVIRVTKVLGADAAIICEVRDGDARGGRVRETKDPRIILGGVDSFWLVTGEKKENRLLVNREESLIPSVSPLNTTYHASSRFNFPMNFDFGNSGSFAAVSFATAARLPIAYSPTDISHEELVVRLQKGVLSVPSEKGVDAIEVRSGLWLTQFDRRPSGYGLTPSTIVRSVPVVTLKNRPETIRLSSGLVIYVTPPRWSPEKEVDLRPEHETLQAAEYWLARATTSIVQSSSNDRLIDLLRRYVASTINTEEMADLSAVIGILSKRRAIIELLPQMMAGEPDFQERIREFERTERDRLRAVLQSRIDEEMQSESARLSGIRADLADAETRLALVTHRESLIRIEAEKHDESIRTKIAEAAKNVVGEASRETHQLREEVTRLRDLIAHPPISTVHAAKTDLLPEKKQQEDAPGKFAIATEEVRRSITLGLASAVAMPVADVATIIMRSTEDFPVLIGNKASRAAADISAAIGGEDSAIAFCDPSRISWQDLLRDETSGLAAAVAKARTHPEVIVAVALCGITNGPCEYWVPQFIESRRLGKLPRNLAVIASAGVDGMRVSVPDSVLEYFVPVLVPASARPVRNLFAGAWGADLEVDKEKLAEAIDLLSKSDSFEKAALVRAAKTLSRTPAGIDMSEVAAALARQEEWRLSLLGEGQQHAFKTYFKNIEG